MKENSATKFFCAFKKVLKPSEFNKSVAKDKGEEVKGVV